MPFWTHLAADCCRSSLLNCNMKARLFLALFVLCTKRCLSNGTAEVSSENLWLLNDTDQQYPDIIAPDPFEETSAPAFSMHNFTEKITNFGFNLYRKIAMKHDNNVFFSPLSMSFTLAAFLLASSGETHNQIAECLDLHLPNGRENEFLALFQQLRDNFTKNEDFTLLQTSFSFIQKDFQIRDIFLNLSKQYFDMEFLSVDFRNSTLAKNIVNEHIKQRLRGKIPMLFDTFDQQTKIILMNYILFRGKWLHPFSSKFTEVEPFHIDKYRTVHVPMMFKTEKFAYTEDKNLQCTVLKLPYKGNAHMLIVMPEKGADYMSIEDHVTSELVESWLKTMQTRKTEIYFPKFKLDQTYYMEQMLQEMGIKDLFSYKADLSNLTDQKYAKVSQILQRSVIHVDERGTEAAAISKSEVMAFSLPLTIRVNQPFLFMIYDGHLKVLLFVGRVTNPMEL
ncbi:protein Z-dependent protease inhibitor isoform X2 [Varanus komodoensis]|uniref:protein Z-dependent protease inhibitor isoform X2 n=1 Tax=Varanus komodoensis TaxID=61221 RepID=UPI001CF7E649|nr:protein Z-dependent protease inhibitor isoform X2 [Varanus komodoensis]